MKNGGFIKSEEARQFIESLTDPMTKILVNNARYHPYRRLAEKHLPTGEFDMRCSVEVMAEMFNEHDVLNGCSPASVSVHSSTRQHRRELLQTCSP